MAGSLEQFIAFGTDAVGLERILRGVEALVQCTAVWPTLLAFVATSMQHPAAQLALVPSLFMLRSRLGLVRRTMRTFRFLNSFKAGWSQYLKPEKTLETWLDVMSKTLLGMYGLLETMTLVDMFDVPNVSVFSAMQTKEYNRQAQICWFAGLCFSVAITLIKLQRGSGEIEAPSEKGANSAEKPPVGETVSGKTANNSTVSEAKVAPTAPQTEPRSGLGIKLVAELLDMLLPASVVGWLDVDRGIVGAIMFLTTILTSIPIWKRFGSDIDGRKISK